MIHVPFGTWWRTGVSRFAEKFREKKAAGPKARKKPADRLKELDRLNVGKERRVKGAHKYVRYILRHGNSPGSKIT